VRDDAYVVATLVFIGLVGVMLWTRLKDGLTSQNPSRGGVASTTGTGSRKEATARTRWLRPSAWSPRSANPCRAEAAGPPHDAGGRITHPPRRSDAPWAFFDEREL
jgi:hypothetical protein